MKRRTLLSAAAGSAAALAGCIGRSIPGGEPVGDGGADGGDGGAVGDGTTDDGASGGDVSVADTRFEVRDVSCGTRTNEASVSRDSAATRIVVEGTVSAPNPCYTAKLGDVRYDAGADEVTVPVSTEEKPDTGVCAQCIAEIEYRAVVAFQGGLPATVVVRHGDEVVATASA